MTPEPTDEPTRGIGHKVLDPRELRDHGYLQEANRRFFHPLGLALRVHVDDATGEGVKVDVVDFREDLEGGVFEWGSDEERADSRVKAGMVQQQWDIRADQRLAALGFVEQPVP